MSDRDLSSQSPGDGMTRGDWEHLPSDPDLHADFGYAPLELEVFEMEVNDQLMILPSDEDMVREDAFIIADESDLLNTDAHR